MMSKYISKSFTTVDPRVHLPLKLLSNNQRKYDTSPDLQLDETSTPWRVATQENNVAIVNTYTVQPNGSTTPTTPGPDAASPGEEDDDGDGLDQLSVKFTRSYHVNKSSKKSPRKGSAPTQQGVTPPASTTFSPPLAHGQFISPGEGQTDQFEYAQNPYEGLGIGNGMTQQGYTLAHVPQYMPQQYMRSPGPMVTGMQGQPLQPLQGNPHVARSPARMVPMQVMQTLSPVAQQVPLQQNVQMQAASSQRLMRQQTAPLPPRQMVYDENTLMQAAYLSQLRQQQQQQQQQLNQLQQAYLSPPIPQSPQRIQKPISRSVPSSPEKRRYVNQLTQVSELDLLSIPTPLVSSPMQPNHTKQVETPSEQPETAHIRGISFLDELFEAQPSPQTKGPIAPDGTLREEDEDDDNGYDEAALEADVNAWLESENLPEGTGWLDQVVLN